MLKMESLPPEIRAINFIMYNKEFSKTVFKEIVKRKFPEVGLVVGYGSGVFPQANVAKHNMIDLLMVVKDRREFHKENIKRNKSHYSGLSWLFGQSYINLINNHIFPVHFNSHIQVQDYTIKYGVMDSTTFHNDLQTWQYHTIAGRLHKPVKLISQNLTPYQQSLTSNLIRALSMAFLLENRQVFTERDLYMRITGMSYLGDVRFWAGLETPKKIGNIVDGNYGNFSRLYQPILKNYFGNNVAIDKENVYIDHTIEFRKKLFNTIPNAIKCKLIKNANQLNNFAINMMIKSPDQVKQELIEALTEINKRSSTRMAIYHALSSSWIKNLQYSLEKLKKSKK